MANSGVGTVSGICKVGVGEICAQGGGEPYARRAVVGESCIQQLFFIEEQVERSQGARHFGSRQSGHVNRLSNNPAAWQAPEWLQPGFPRRLRLPRRMYRGALRSVLWQSRVG